MAATPGTETLAEGVIQFSMDDADLLQKLDALKEKTKNLGESIESGFHQKIQRSAISTNAEFKRLTSTVNKQLADEVRANKRAAEEIARVRKYGYTMGNVGNFTERFREQLKERNISPTSAMLKAGAVGTAVIAGGAAIAGQATSDMLLGSFKMLGLTTSRSLIPAIVSVSKWAQKTAHYMDALNDKYPKLTAAAGYAAVALASVGALAGVVHGVRYVASSIASAGGIVRGMAGYGASAFATTAGMAAMGGFGAGRVPPPPSVPPMIKGSWTGGTAPTAQFAPPGATSGALATGAGTIAMAGAKTIVGGIIRSTVAGLAAYLAYEVGSAIVDNIGDKKLSYTGTVGGLKAGEYDPETGQANKKRSTAMPNLMQLHSFGVTDYREAAQSAVLNQSPLDAQNFQMEVKNYIALQKEVAEEMKVAADKFRVAADGISQVPKEAPTPPGWW